MKKLAKHYLFAVLLIFGASTMLTSCDEKAMEDFVESVNLVGKWNCSETIHSSDRSIRPFFDGYIQFEANHTFTDSHGDRGEWSIKNRTITLDYHRGYAGIIQMLVQEGYTTEKMVLTTTINLGYDRQCFSTVTLRNIHH